MVSVIIPTYNRAKMLETALASVFRQTMLPEEILVVDDRSTDDTGNRIAALRRRSPVPLRYLKLRNGTGPAAARNAGIRAASGRSLAFLDSDDLWHRKKLEVQCRTLASYPQYLVSHTRERWYRRGRHLNQKRKHQPPQGRIFTRCVPMCCVGMSTVIARQELFEKFGLFDESLPCCEDYEYWLRVSAGTQFLLIDRALTIKQGGRSDQLSMRYRIGMDRFRIQALGKILYSGQLTGKQQTLVREEMVAKCLIYGMGCIKHNKPLEGKHYVTLAKWLSDCDQERRIGP